MLTLPDIYSTLLRQFAPLFSGRVWGRVEGLLVGAILAPGRRTVAAVLRILGRSGERHFQNFHRVLSRDRWSGLAASRVLLGLLVRTLAPRGVLVFGLDDTLERGRGKKIAARGVYHDAARSSHKHFVKASGLRWLSLMLLAPVSWAGRVWALPFLTALCPSERYYQQRGRDHQTLVERAGQMLRLLRRWLPDRELVVVADSTFAARELLGQTLQLRRPLVMITRLRLNAALYASPLPRQPRRRGPRPRIGARLPGLAQVLQDPATAWQRVAVPAWYGEGRRAVEIVSERALWYRSGRPLIPIRWVLIRDPQARFQPQALLCTAGHLAPEQILEWFVLRWQVEVTFQEVRTHLGVETQRQWSARAIERTTPALLGLLSLVTLLAGQHVHQGKLPIRQAAWYLKAWPTFADALAVVRQQLWSSGFLQQSLPPGDGEQFGPAILEHLLTSLCYTS